MTEFAVDLSRAYNDYLYDRFLRDETRLKGIAVLPLQDVPAAVAELRRAVKDYGMTRTIPPTAPAVSRSEERAILTVTCSAAFLFFNSFGSICCIAGDTKTVRQ